MPELNLWAVLAAAFASFLLGGIWYSVLFPKVWDREVWAGVPGEHRLKSRNPAVVFDVGFLLSLIAASVFAMFLGPAPELGFAVGAGAAAGLGWVATSLGINYLFSARSLTLWFIDAGYHTLQFTLFGLILGLWH